MKHREESSAETARTVTEVFAGEPAETAAPEPQIENLFVRLGKATREPGSIEFERLISVDAMIEAMRSDGMLDRLDRGERRAFERGFRKGIAQFEQGFSQMAYDRHEIMRVEKPSSNQRVVYVRHYDSAINVTFPMRWWLTQTDDGWRIYDYEDLSVGLRTVSLVGSLMRAGVGSHPEPWIQPFTPLAVEMRTLDYGDETQMNAFGDKLIELRRHALPEPIERFASAMLITTHLACGRHEDALAELEAAREGGHASPMWHYQMANTLAGLGRHEDAIVELETYAGRFGWDSDGFELLSDFHLELGRVAEAREAAIRGLADQPGAPFCLASLAAASSPEELRDPFTVERFAEAADIEGAYEVALDYLIDSERTEQARVLFEMFRSEVPDSQLHGYYEEVLSDDPNGE